MIESAAGKMQTREFRTRSQAIFLIIVVLAAISSLSSALLVYEVAIRATGNIEPPYIAASGSATDIQIAVNSVAATGGGIVMIPAGTWDFGEGTVSIPGGITVIGDADPPTGKGAGTIRTVLVLPPDGTADRTMFSVNGANGLPVRILGIHFLGRTAVGSATGDTLIYINNVKDFIVHNCQLELSGYHGVHVFGPSSQGVISHSDFINNYKAAALSAQRGWGYGVAVDKNYYIADGIYEPDITKILGQYTDPANPAINAVFIEDSYFAGNRHSVAANSNAHYIFRYNEVHHNLNNIPYDFHQVDAHGSYGVTQLGTRCIEVYNNHFYHESTFSSTAIMWRGGGGVAFDNTLFQGETVNYYTGIRLANEGGAPLNEESRTKDIWLWNNAGPTRVDFVITDGTVILGTHYWLTPPPFTYIHYSYPHPLTGET